MKANGTKIGYFARRYPFSILCQILIWTLSLTPFFPETPLDDVRFFDKWTHLAMYGGTTMVIWIEYLCCHEKLDRKALFQWVSVAMVLLGGVIELLQEHATTTRSGEWLDFVADVVGVLLGVLAGMVLNRFWFRRR